jgi:DNA-directed RNA polymerase sigma subunit (sigma70/sigma32)
MKIAKEPISTELAVGDEGDATLGDFIEDTDSVPPMEAAMQANLRPSSASCSTVCRRARPRWCGCASEST